MRTMDWAHKSHGTITFGRRDASGGFQGSVWMHNGSIHYLQADLMQRPSSHKNV